MYHKNPKAQDIQLQWALRFQHFFCCILVGASGDESHRGEIG